MRDAESRQRRGPALHLALSALPVIAAAAAVLAMAVARNAGRMGLMQAPNARSSHRAPTPSGGGLAIVACGVLAGLAAAFVHGPLYLAIVALAAVTGALGFADDRHDLPARWRLAVELAAVAALVAALAATTPLLAAFAPLPAWLAVGALVLFGTGWLNFYNFMDGIDGLAAAQAVFMASAAVAVALLGSGEAGGAWGWGWLLLALAAAAAGFLLPNWPPARIFMGDAGALFLAFMLFALALLSVADGALRWPVWPILGALFLTDTLVTLAVRMLRGERWYAAHRLHAYQHLARRWGGHRPVTLLYAGINLGWLAPLALLAQSGPLPPLAVAAIAYLPLIVLVSWARAGRAE